MRPPRDRLVLFAIGTAGAAIAISTALPDASWWAKNFGGGIDALDPRIYVSGARWWRGLLLVSAAALLLAPWLPADCPALHPAEGTPAEAPERSGPLPLLVILAAALLLRTSRLGESLWYDEIAAWLQFGTGGPGFIVGNYFDPANHVAQTLCTWISVLLLGPGL
ncbi:MAG: hypothetical protein ACYTGC_02770, partial [Planctomycetota bacterium]